MRPPRPAPGGFPVVGIIGGGQLARMCAGPAAELALTLSVLTGAPDDAAAQVIPSAPVGGHDDLPAVLEFAAHCDVVTFDHEHVPPDVLAARKDLDERMRNDVLAALRAACAADECKAILRAIFGGDELREGLAEGYDALRGALEMATSRGLFD